MTGTQGVSKSVKKDRDDAKMNAITRNLARKTVESFVPYAWEDDSEAIAERFGLKRDEVVRFDMNTSPFPLQTETVIAAAKKASTEIGEYPDPAYRSLLPALSAYAGCKQDELTICAGCDEAIDVLAKVFVDNNGKVVVSAPAYSMGKICSEIMGGKVVSVMRDRAKGFPLEPQPIIEAAKGAQMVYLCNPNSPTGNADRLEAVRSIIESVDCAVVVDEVYFEFWGQSLAKEVNAYPNLVVCRSLSKAFGMAGARLGYCIANAKLSAQINKVRPPNSVSGISVELAKLALSQQPVMRSNIASIKKERGRLVEQLEKSGLEVFPSVTNFVLVDFGSPRQAKTVFDGLLSKGLVVRNLSGKAGLEGCLRITVRSPTDNDRLISGIAGLA